MENLYQILGVLPTAEDVVIAAAYRALASRYHPDKWKGDIDEATNKMAEINLAYQTLSDNGLRKKYDENFGKSGEEHELLINDDATEAAFSAALDEVEAKWAVALKIFPDLANYRDGLQKISPSLAYSFVSTLLENKSFNLYESVAKRLEADYFSTYFGDNQKIINFAKELIQLNCRSALRALNIYLEVLGEETDPDRIIKVIVDEYSILDVRKSEYEKNITSKKTKDELDRLKEVRRNVMESGFIDSAAELMRMLGFDYKIQSNSTYFSYKEPTYTVSKDGVLYVKNANYEQMISWVRKNLI
jgi:DnaJ domain